MRLLHLSDTHYLVDYGKNQDLFRQIFPQMTSPLEKLKLIAQEVAQVGPIDLICHTGDLTHLGQEGDYRGLKQGLDRLFPGVPLVVCPGNRDILPHFLAVFPGEEGGIFQTLELPGLLVLSVDNTDATTPGGVFREESCLDAIQILKNYPNIPCLLQCHHHFLEEQPSPPCQTGEGIRELLSQPNLAGILTGHTHHPHQGSWEGVPYFTANALSFVATAQGDGQLEVAEAGGYHLFTLESGKLQLEQVGTLPQQGRVLGQVQV